MKRFFFAFLIIVISLAVGYPILSIWMGIYSYRKNPSRESLLKAIRFTPSNPDPFYKLGLFYQWDILNIDLKESVRYFQEAIERNPLEQQYWLNLAKTLYRIGERGRSEEALKKAILVFPTSYQGRWVSGNLLLQQGEMEKAIPHLTYLLENYPDQSGLVYDILFKSVVDVDFILEKIVPKESSSFRQFLSYLYEIGDKEWVKKGWTRKASYGMKADRTETLRHIEFLISHGEIHEAYQVWVARIRQENLPIFSDGNLVTNGGFEKEKVLGSGFDWKMTPVEGVKIAFDPAVAFEGKGSLRITFDGKENVDFHHIYQYVSWIPNTDYVLKTYMKTKAVTTKSGVKIEVSGVGPPLYVSSEPWVGDNEWKEVIISFRTPPQSQGGLIRIKRTRTDKFDRFISGTVWIDHVRLTERELGGNVHRPFIH
jgi:hypothetical protein